MPKLLPRVFHSITLPVNCRNCGFNIGGTREAAAVLVYENTNEKVFSVNTSTRDDRCFVMQEGSNFLRSHHQCKTRRATYVSSELTKDFACSLTEKCKQAANTDNNVYELSPETIDKYQGDSSVKEMLLSVHDRVASSWLSCCV